MSENIQSIANGSFVLGQTSATNFVAGPGIKIDEPSAGTVRIGNDETVLFDAVSAHGVTGNVTLSETRDNFDHVRIIYRQNDGHNECKEVYNIDPTDNLTLNSFTLFQNFTINKISKYTISGNQITLIDGGEYNTQGWSTNKCIYILQVIGIGRISGNA